MPLHEASPEHARTVLDRRARVLARPLAPAVDDDVLHLVTFTLAEETYAVESSLVLEMFRAVDIAPLPGAVPPIFGVTAWRGELLPVIDLRSLLGLPDPAPGAHPMLVVLGKDRGLLGVPVDAPGDVLNVPRTAVQRPEGITAAAYVHGVTPRAELILNVDQILQAAGSEPV